MSKIKKATLSEVAKQSGVSISTVSMIINNISGVSFSQETVNKVMNTVKELNYISKKDKESPISSINEKVIVIICPNIYNPYYSTIVQSIEYAAKIENYGVMILNTYRSPSDERRILSLISNINVAGIIFSMMPSDPSFAEKISTKIPMVVIGDSDCSVNIDTVEVSNYKAGVLIGKHLIELGHKHIAFISPTLDNINTARTKRLEGIKDTFIRAGNDYSILVKSQTVSPGTELKNLSIEHSIGYEHCLKCLNDKRITAFVGLNDMISYGIIDAIINSGYSIPKDYSVCGFDNIFPSNFSSVSLTTVEHCIDEIGHNAFMILYNKIKNTSYPNLSNGSITRVEYQHRIINRSSTGIVR